MNKYEYLFVIAGLAIVWMCVGAYVLDMVNSADLWTDLF